MADFIVDMETMSVSDDAIILSIAAIAIPDNLERTYSTTDLSNMGKVFYALPDVSSQKAKNRKVEQSTVEWWANQGEEARQVLSMDNRADVSIVLNDFHSFFFKNGFDKDSLIWTRGMIDQRWYQSLCNSFDIENVLPFWQWRDTRTALHVLCGNPNGDVDLSSFQFKKHYAVHDCIMDMYRLQKVIANYDVSMIPF